MRTFLSCLKKIIFYISITAFSFVVISFGWFTYIVKSTQWATDDIYEILKNKKTIESIFEEPGLPDKICIGTSIIHFSKESRLVFSDLCRSRREKRRGEDTLLGLYPKYRDHLNKSDQVVLTIAPTFPYRGTIKINFDESYKITKINPPYFWD